MPLKDAARNFFHLLYSSSQLQKLIRCVEKMPYTLPPTDKISESTTLIDFVHRSGTWIEAHANEIPDEFFGLLSESQVQNIDFSKLSRQQTIFLMEHFPVELLSDEKIKSINPVSFRDWGVKGNLFPFIFWENSPKVREEIKHRVSLLTKEQVDVVAEQRDRVLLLLTDEQVKRFDEKTLGSNSLYEVMPALSKKQRFALLSSKQLNIILNLVLSRLKEASAQKVENVPVKLSWRPDLFPEFVACELKELEGILETVGSVISDEQIKNLNVNNMSKLLFCSLFRTQNLKENQRRFSLLSDQQVNTIVNLGDWGVVDTAGALLTDIQIKNLDIKNLDIHAFRHLFPASGDERRNARRVHQLSTAQVNDLVNKQQPIYQFLYFSDEQIKNLETKNLNKEVVRAIFPGNIRKDLLKHRLSLLFPEKLQSIVDKLDADQLSCLNATQRRSLQVK
jgi:hypothetical protein